MAVIGKVSEAWRYPVKSMAGEMLDEAYVSYAGVMGDRVFGFLNKEKHANKNNFPWFSIRDFPAMLLYKARFVESLATTEHYPDANGFDVEVETPDGEKGLMSNPQFISRLQHDFGHDFLLRFSEKGMHDARPISLFGLGTIKQLEQEAELALDRRRFRANFYVDWVEETGFFEDTLIGKTLRIGDICEIYIQKKDPRCQIISVDPVDGQANPKVLQSVARNHKGCAGVYGVVIREGVVKKGDLITLL